MVSRRKQFYASFAMTLASVFARGITDRLDFGSHHLRFKNSSPVIERAGNPRNYRINKNNLGSLGVVRKFNNSPESPAIHFRMIPRKIKWLEAENR